jgi:hypothetical protein
MTIGAEAAEPQPAWEHPNPLLSIRLLFADTLLHGSAGWTQ